MYKFCRCAFLKWLKFEKDILKKIVPVLYILLFNLGILHFSGKVDSFTDKFIIFPKGRANTSALSLRKFAGI